MNNFSLKSFRIPFKDCNNFQIDYESIQITLNVEWHPPGQSPNLIIHIANRTFSGSSCESTILHSSTKDSQDSGLSSFNPNQFAASKKINSNGIQPRSTELASVTTLDSSNIENAANIQRNYSHHSLSPISTTIPSILDRSENRTSPSSISQRALTSSNSSSPQNIIILANNGVQKQLNGACSTTQSPPNSSIYSTDQQISAMIASPTTLFPSTIKPLYCSCANPNHGHTDNCPAKESQKPTAIVTNSPISSLQFTGTMFERQQMISGTPSTVPSANLEFFQSNGMRSNQSIPENRPFHTHLFVTVDAMANALQNFTTEYDTTDDVTLLPSQWVNIANSSEKITPVHMSSNKKQRRVSSARPKKVLDKQDNDVQPQTSNIPISTNNDQNDHKIGESSDQSCSHVDQCSLLIICEESPEFEENPDTDSNSKSNTQNGPRSPISIDPDLLKKRTSINDQSTDRVQEIIEKVVEQCRNDKSATDSVQSSMSNPSQTVNQQGFSLKIVDLSTETITTTINDQPIFSSDQSQTQIQSATNGERVLKQAKKRKSPDSIKEPRNRLTQSRCDAESSIVISGASCPISFHCDQPPDESFTSFARNFSTRLETNLVTQSNSDQSFNFRRPVNGSLPPMTEHATFPLISMSSVDPDNSSSYLLDSEHFDGSQDPFPMIDGHRLTSYNHSETTTSLYHPLGNNRMNRSNPNNNQTSTNMLSSMNLSLSDDELLSAIETDTSSARESITQYLAQPIFHDYQNSDNIDSFS